MDGVLGGSLTFDSLVSFPTGKMASPLLRSLRGQPPSRSSEGEFPEKKTPQKRGPTRGTSHKSLKKGFRRLEPVASRTHGGSQQLHQSASGVASLQTRQSRGTAWDIDDDDEPEPSPGDEKRVPRAPVTLADHIARPRVIGPCRGIRTLRASRTIEERYNARNTLTKLGKHIASYLDFGRSPRPEVIEKVLRIIDRAFMGGHHPAVTGVCLTAQDAVKLLPQGIPKTITSLRNSDTYLTAIANAVELYQYQRFLHRSYMNYRLEDVEYDYEADGSESTKKATVWRGALLGHILGPDARDEVVTVVDTVFLKRAERRFMYPRIEFDAKTLTLSVWKQYSRYTEREHRGRSSVTKSLSPPFEAKTSFSDAKIAFEYVSTHMATFFSDYDEGTDPVVLGDQKFVPNQSLREEWDIYQRSPIAIDGEVDWYSCDDDLDIISLRDLIDSTVTQIDKSLRTSPETESRQTELRQNAREEARKMDADMPDSDDDDDDLDFGRPRRPRRRHHSRVQFVPVLPST